MALDVGKQVAFWRSGADEALGAAELLIQSGRYNFGLFFLHLALEKLLKAIVARETGDLPPKTHDLLLLAERANLTIKTQISVVLGEFQAYCMAGRYPDSAPVSVDRAFTERELVRAKEVFTWLQQQFSK